MYGLLAIVGIILVIIGVIWLLSGSLIGGIVLIVVGMVMMGSGGTFYGRRGTPL